MASTESPNAARRLAAVWQVFLLCCLVSAAAASGQPGTLDPNFSLPLKPEEEPRHLAVARDGSVYVQVNEHEAATKNIPFVVRFLPNGERDEAFRAKPPTGNTLVLGFGVSDDKPGNLYLWGLLGTPDGGVSLMRRFREDGSHEDLLRKGDLFKYAPEGVRILPGGGFWASGRRMGWDDFALLRFTESGEIDGSALAVFRTNWFVVKTIHPRADGRVMVTGQIQWPDPGGRIGRMGGAQYLPDGSLDPDFDPDPTSSGAGPFPTVWTSVILEDDRVLLGGLFSFVGKHPTTAIARLLPNGRVDPTFSAKGIDGDVSVIDPGAGGRLLIRGSFKHVEGLPRDGVARLHSDGSLDAGFAVVLPPGAVSQAIAPTADGRLLVALAVPEGKTLRRYIGRLDDGESDIKSPPLILAEPEGASRRVGGEFHTEVNARSGLPLAFQWFQNGSPIDGATHPALRLSDLHLHHNGTYFVRVSNAAGSVESQPFFLVVEPTTGRPGWTDLTFDFGGQSGDEVRAIAFRPDGRMLIGGSFPRLSRPRVGGRLLIQYHADATVDREFTERLAIVASEIRTILILPDESVVVGGGLYRVNGEPRRGLARVLPDGSLDPQLVPELDSYSDVTGVAPLADGRWLIAGHLRIDGNEWGVPLLRLMPDGRLDRSFSNPPGTGRATDLAASPDGRAFVVTPLLTPRRSARLVKLNEHGDAEDPSFEAFNVRGEPPFRLLSTDPNTVWIAGDIFLNGQDRRGTNFMLVSRISAEGFALPMRLGIKQRRVGTITSLAMDQRGRLLFGGRTLNRLTEEGAVDPGFETETDGAILAMGVDLAGDVIIGGTFNVVGGVRRPALARIYGEDRSEPYLVGPFLHATGIQLKMETFEGWTYELEVADRLEEGAWRSALVFQGDGRRQIIEDSDPNTPHRFYRVRVRH